MKRQRMETQFHHSIPGPTPPAVDAARRLHTQAQRCAAGDHVYTWSGQIVDVPGGSPHLVMACAYGAAHKTGSTSPKLVGPPLTPENMAKRLWTEEEVKQARSIPDPHTASPAQGAPKPLED
jgi:hypothetical protein